MKDHFDIGSQYASVACGAGLGFGLSFAAGTVGYAIQGNLVPAVATGIVATVATGASLYSIINYLAPRNEFRKATALITATVFSVCGITSVFNSYTRQQDQQPQQKLVAPAATPSAPTR